MTGLNSSMASKSGNFSCYFYDWHRTPCYYKPSRHWCTLVSKDGTVQERSDPTATLGHQGEYDQDFKSGKVEGRMERGVASLGSSTILPEFLWKTPIQFGREQKDGQLKR